MRVAIDGGNTPAGTGKYFPQAGKGGPRPGKTVGNNYNGNGSGLEDIRLLDGAVAARLSSSVDTAQDSITQPPLPAPVRRPRKIDNQRLPRRNNGPLTKTIHPNSCSMRHIRNGAPTVPASTFLADRCSTLSVRSTAMR